MGPRRVGGPKFRAFPLPPPLRSFCVSLGVFSWFFSGVWKRWGPQMCTFGLLGLSCEAAAGPKAAGVSHHSPRAQTCTFEVPVVRCSGFSCFCEDRPDGTKNGKKTFGWAIILVRISVKASPADSRRRSFRVSTGVHVEHRWPKAGDPHEGLLKVERWMFRLGFRCSGGWLGPFWANPHPFLVNVK